LLPARLQYIIGWPQQSVALEFCQTTKGPGQKDLRIGLKIFQLKVQQIFNTVILYQGHGHLEKTSRSIASSKFIQEYEDEV